MPILRSTPSHRIPREYIVVQIIIVLDLGTSILPSSWFDSQATLLSQHI